MKTILKVSGVKQCFGKKSVLEHVNLEVEEGEIFGLLGPSGAGKTTLIKIMTGQLAPTEGIAEVFGTPGRCKSNSGDVSGEVLKNPAALGRGEICRGIGMMMDNFGLYERLSCHDNLKFYAKLQGFPIRKTVAVLKKVGLFQARKTTAAKLSKGMRSRLLLARALLAEPKLLFLDEPTSGLDPATAAEIYKLIREEQKKGTTIFLTTHNMVEAEKLCNHVALLHEGRIVEYGNPGEICRKYHHQKKLLLHLAGGEDVVLPHDKSGAEKLLFYLEEGRLETVHSTEPNLENVFMELTGRRLEE